jgi:hypothetical protein
MFVRRRPLLCAATVGGGAYLAGRSMGRAAQQRQYDGHASGGTLADDAPEAQVAG